MTDVVDQRESLGELAIQAQSRRDGARDLRDFQGVREAVSEVIGIARSKNLGLGFEAPKCASVNDAVAIARVFGAVRMTRLRITAAARKLFAHGQSRE